MKSRSVIFSLVLLVVGFLLTGCMKSSLDAKGFREHMGALGYNVSETEKPEYDTGINYLVASKEGVNYTVEYYEFDEEVEAKKVYEKYKKDIKSYITSTSNNNETKGALFAKTIAKSENEYVVISRVRSTIIFIATTKEYTNEVDKLLEELGY